MTEKTTLHQSRVSLLSLVLFALSLGFVVLQTAAYQPSGEGILHDWLVAHGNVFNWALVGVFLATGLATRGKTRSIDLVHVLDALAIAFGSTALALSSYEVRMLWPAAHIALLGMTNMIISRAILVPSTWERTLAISGASAIGPIVLACVAAFDETAVHGDTPPALAVANAALWAAVAVALATIVSGVVHGLRRQVKAARQLGQYRLEEKIGAGAMGVVYRAEHALLRRPTAIKLIEGTEITEAQLRHFEHEVQVTARLTHPNTISVFDFGRTPDGVFYYAMEYLEGLNLEELVRDYGRLPPARIVHVLTQVASALAEAHAAGLVHRDVKPANVFLCDRGGQADFVKVLDFGLVKDQSSTEKEEGVVGTPLYLAPEAIRTPDAVSASVDLYALGATAYFLATGRPPFEGTTVFEVCSHHLRTAPTPLSVKIGPDFPADLERVILRCLAKTPAERPRDALALREELRACADFGRWSEREAREFFDALPPRRAPSRAPQTRALEIDVAGRVREAP